MSRETLIGTGSPRPVAILVTGPLHLFRTSGIYYARALAEHYDVVIVGFDDYAGDPTATMVSKWPGIRAMEMLPARQSGLAFHRAAVGMARRLARLAPALVLQHSESYVHNQYIARAMPISARQGSYANGMTLDQDQDFRYIRGERIAALSRRFLVPPLVAPLAYRLREAWNDAVNHSLLPLLLTGHLLRPRQNPITGRIFPDRPTRTAFRFMYSRREMALYSKALPHDILVLTQHPMTNTGTDVHRSLGMSEEPNGIAFLPTWGMTTALKDRLGADAAFAHIYRTWEQALLILRQRLGPIPIRIKLHPGSANDPISRRLVRDLAGRIEAVTVLDPSTSAERLVLASSCVLGDVSSILWWTYLLGGRQIVSVNAWGLPLGDEMRHYPGIICVTDPAELANTPLQVAQPRDQSALLATDYLRDLIPLATNPTPPPGPLARVIRSPHDA